MHDDYRRAAADLAYAQTHYARSESTGYLNTLVSRAHGELYGSRPSRAKTFRAFVLRGYPMLVRRHWKPMAVSAALLFGPAAIAYLLAFLDYGLASALVPEVFQQALGQAQSGGVPAADITASLAPLMAAFITANNLQVSFSAFAGGMTAGVYTAWALARNGMMLGALAGMFGAADLDLEFWSLIVPHGGLELLAITIAGGSGLLMGSAIVAPGDLPRLEALRRVAPDAARVVLGTVPLFIVAGLIEGFFTPGPFDPYVKIGAGLFVLAVAVLYLVLPGRDRSRTAPMGIDTSRTRA